MNTFTRNATGLWLRTMESAFALAAVAGVLSAAYLTIDTHIGHNVIHLGDDRLSLLTSSLVYLTYGGWVGWITTLLTNRFLFKKTGSGFKREYSYTGRFQKLVFATGVLSAVATAAELYVASSGDPGILIALANFNIVYLIVWDHFKGNRPIRVVLPAAACAVVGATLAAIKSWGLASFPLEALILMLGLNAGLTAFSSILEQKVARESSVVNMNTWRFFWLAAAATVLSPVLALSVGTLSLYLELLGSVLIPAFGWMVVLMIFVSIQHFFKLRAQEIGNVSEVAVVNTIRVGLAVPITLIGTMVAPGLFSAPQDPNIWVVRAFGTILLGVGIYKLSKIMGKSK